MNNNLKYVATNMTMLFWVNEMITGAKLKKQGKILRVGSNKSGYWQIKE